MNILIDPNVSFLLLVVGIVVAVLALISPGTIVLEVTAVFAIFLAILGMASLNVNFWALIILLVGIFPLIILVRRTHKLIFLAVAMLALVIGSAFLLVNPDGSLAVNPTLSIPVALIAAVILWIIARRGLEAVALRPAFNLDDLMGKTGEARTDILQEGTVYIGSEAWTARSKRFIAAGSQVRVVGREGLILKVEKINKP